MSGKPNHTTARPEHDPGVIMSEQDDLQRFLQMSKERAAGGVRSCSLGVLQIMHLVEAVTGEDVGRDSIIDAGELQIFNQHQQAVSNDESVAFAAAISDTEALYAQSHGDPGSKQQEIYYVNSADKGVYKAVHLWTLIEEEPISGVLTGAVESDAAVCSSAYFHPVVDKEDSLNNALTSTVTNEQRSASLTDEFEHTGVIRKDILDELESSMRAGVVTDALLESIRMPEIKQRYLPVHLKHEAISHDIDGSPNQFASRVRDFIEWAKFTGEEWSATKELETGSEDDRVSMSVATDARNSAMNVTLTHHTLGSSKDGRSDISATIRVDDITQEPIIDSSGLGAMPAVMTDAIQEMLGVVDVHVVDEHFMNRVSRAIQAEELRAREETGVDMPSHVFLSKYSEIIGHACNEYRSRHSIKRNEVLDIGAFDISALGAGTLFSSLTPQTGRVRARIIANEEQQVFKDMKHLYDCSVIGAGVAFENASGERLMAQDCESAFVDNSDLDSCRAFECGSAFTTTKGYAQMNVDTTITIINCVAASCDVAFRTASAPYDLQYAMPIRLQGCIATDCGSAFTTDNLVIKQEVGRKVEEFMDLWHDCVAVQCGVGSFTADKYKEIFGEGRHVANFHEPDVAGGLVYKMNNRKINQRHDSEVRLVRGSEVALGSGIMGYASGIGIGQLSSYILTGAAKFTWLGMAFPYPIAGATVGVVGAAGVRAVQNRRTRKRNEAMQPVFTTPEDV